MTSDLPLTKDPTSRYVPWIVGLMMYLGMLSTLLFCLFQSYFQEWTEDIEKTFTVEVHLPQIEAADQKEHLEAQAQRIKSYLESFPGVMDVTLLDQEQLSQTLVSWLGDMDVVKNIDLPIYIEGKIHKEDSGNIRIIQHKIQEIYPSSRIIDHGAHFAPLKKLGISFKVFILMMLGAFFLASMATLSFSVQTSLLIHKPIIDILSLLGASDAYIAREFKKHALHMAIGGACFAFLLGALTFLGGCWIFRGNDAFYLFLFSFKDPYSSWLVSLCVSFIMGFLIIFFAHHRVKKILKVLS